MRALFGGIAVATLLVAGVAHGQPRPDPRADEYEQGGTPQGGPERLVVKPFPGAPWKRITDKAGAQGWIHEQAPASHADTDYSEMLTDQAFVANRGADPAGFLRTVFAQVGGACTGAKVSGPTPRTEGGVRVAYGIVRCGTQRGERFGVHIFYKVIDGQAALYSISWEMRVPASDDGDLLSFPKGHERDAAELIKAEAEADQYLSQQVYLCGGRSTDARCAK
jgi:hypothetical protein